MRPSPATDLWSSTGWAGPAAAGLALAVSTLVGIGALFAGGVILLALGGTLSGWLVVPAVAAAASAGAGVRGGGVVDRSGRAWLLRAAILTLAVLGAAGGAMAGAARFHDVSWDGQVYHQPAVLALAGGWNPLWDGPLPLQDRPDNLWINHYPKAAWVAQAILLRATGSLEAVKGLQGLALLAALLAVFAALRPRLRPVPALLCAALAAANPVALVQGFSFYVDGLLASLFACLMALAWLWRRAPGPSLALALGAVLALLVNLKFTGLIYAVVLSAGLTLALFWPARGLAGGLAARGPRFVGICALALGLGTLGLGFDPYVRNTVTRGHPMFPVAGAQSVDFLRIQLTPTFHEHSRPVRLVLGLLAETSNDNGAPRFKIPFTIQRQELAPLASADLRLGGFGPLFGGIALTTVAVILFRRRLALPLPAVALVVGGAVLLSALCNPALWWARYVPQLWLLPVGLFGLLLQQSGQPAQRSRQVAALALGGLLLVNCAVTGGAALVAQTVAARQVAGQLLALGPGPHPVRWNGFDGNRWRLDSSHIGHQAVTRLSCPDPVRLVGSQAQLCPAATAPPRWVPPSGAPSPGSQR